MQWRRNCFNTSLHRRAVLNVVSADSQICAAGAAALIVGAGLDPLTMIRVRLKVLRRYLRRVASELLVVTAIFPILSRTAFKGLLLLRVCQAADCKFLCICMAVCFSACCCWEWQAALVPEIAEDVKLIPYQLAIGLAHCFLGVEVEAVSDELSCSDDA
eukprot:6209038-Pleurochrysis_carterae.AAC.4